MNSSIKLIMMFKQKHLPKPQTNYANPEPPSIENWKRNFIEIYFWYLQAWNDYMSKILNNIF